MEDPFDKMIREVRDAKNISASDRIAREVNRIEKRAPEALPDAVVLCTLKITCLHCKHVYETPSHYLLLRTGRNYIHNTKSLLMFAGLPREHIVKEDVVDYCGQCWNVEPQAFFH